jgi:hypothetical protein
MLFCGFHHRMFREGISERGRDWTIDMLTRDLPLVSCRSFDLI